MLPIYLYIDRNRNHQSWFNFDTPTVWNDLADDVHSAPNHACFR